MNTEKQDVIITLSQELSQEDTGRYIRIPFIVPDGIQRMIIKCSIGTSHGNAIDFGVDDINGYRGWSNMYKKRIVLSESYASVGYMKGAIIPGKWQMIIGVFQVETECTVKVDIIMIPEVPAWYAGDLHMHSIHSDGSFQVNEVIQYAKEAGLDYIALTDHNTFTQNDAIVDREDMVIIPGVELTTYKGHANCWGIKQPFSHFTYTDGDDEEQVMIYLKEAEKSGALVSMNHPFHKDRWLWDKYKHDFRFVEIINAYEAQGNREAINWWHEELCKGRRIVAVGGSDVHRKEPVKWYGTPTTWVQAKSMDQKGILTALKEGKVCVATSREAPRVSISIEDTRMGDSYVMNEEASIGRGLIHLTCELSRGIDGILVIISSKGYVGEVPVVSNQEEYTLSVETHVLFYRVELYDESKSKLLAVTNPIYIQS